MGRHRFIRYLILKEVMKISAGTCACLGQRHKGVGKKHLREAAAKKHDSRMRKIEVNMKNLWIKIGVIVAVIILVAGLGFRITMLKSVKIKGNVLYTNEEIKEFIMPGIWNKNAFVLYVKDK